MDYIEKDYGNGVWEVRWSGKTLAEAMSQFCGKHAELRVTAMYYSKLIGEHTCVAITEHR